MNSELSKVTCPVCDNPILLDNKHWIVTCSVCKKDIQVILYNGKVASVRQYISLSHPENNVEIFMDYLKSNLPLEKWGFSRSAELSNGHIFDSEFCRVRFELSLRDYFPLFATNIFYGRLHAPNNEQYMNWQGEKCLCWHSNMQTALAFIEGISAQQLVDDGKEIWQSRAEVLNVDYPPEGFLEYPLRLHSRIWERYGKKFFSIFDLRQPEFWDEYSKFSDEYNKLLNEYFHQSFMTSRDVERIC